MDDITQDTTILMSNIHNIVLEITSILEENTNNMATNITKNHDQYPMHEFEVPLSQ